MSAPDRDVLERNLALLVGRAYEPVLPEPAFRRALHERYLETLREVAPVPAPLATRRRRLALVAAVSLPLVAAAALVLVLLHGPDEPAPASREAILAAGSVAWRELASDPWRPWTEHERPAAAAPRLELATPTARGVAVELEGGDRVDLAERTELVARRAEPTGRTLELAAGGVELVRERRGHGAWRLETPHGTAALERGALSARLEGEAGATALLLREGAGRVLDGEDWIALRPGVPTRLSGGRVLPEEDAPLRPSTGPAREEVPVATRDEPPAGEPADTEEPPTEASPSIAVTVTTDSGAPPPDEYRLVLVELLPLPDVREPSVRTVAHGETGRHLLSGLSPGRYALDVVAEGFAPWRAPEILVEEGPPVEVVARLQSGLRLRGLVLGPDGRPVEGAAVLSEAEAPPQPLSMDVEDLPGPTTRTARTDRNGRFELPRLRPGEHVLRASHPELASGWSERMTLESGSEAPEVTIRLTRGGTIRGRVETEDGLPWAGVHVLATLGEAGSDRILMSYRGQVTDEGGAFEIDRLPAGYYVLVRLGPEVDPAAGEQSDFRFVELRDGETVEESFLAESKGVRLGGRLVTRSGLPVANMGLSIVKQDDRSWQEADQLFALSGSDGSFEVPDVPPGRYGLYITPDRGSTVVKVDEFDVPPQPEFERVIELADGGIGGVLLDGRTGEPAHNCFVILTQIEDPGDPGTFVARQLTREDGRFHFPNVREYYYRVTAQSTVGNYGHSSVEEILPRTDGEPLTIELFPGGTLSSLVLDEGGAPIAGASLRFLDEDGIPISFGLTDTTGSDGRYVARGVRPGTWTVTASAPGHAPATAVVRVAAELTEELEFVLESRDESVPKKR